MSQKFKVNHKEKRGPATGFEPSCCGFQYRCSHLNFRYCAASSKQFPDIQGVQIQMHSETCKLHDKNIQSEESNLMIIMMMMLAFFKGFLRINQPMIFKSVIPVHSHKNQNDKTITSKTQGGGNLYESLLDFHAKTIISYFHDTFNVHSFNYEQVFFDYWIVSCKLKIYVQK